MGPLAIADCLREMGFSPCKAEPDIWMWPNGDVYEYIAVYVDDLAIAAKDAQSIINTYMFEFSFENMFEKQPQNEAK